MRTETTTCCIAGGGPAGMMLGLLLARAGVDVIVLEKHADFLRDFRGDTVHPSTLELLAELGIIERLLEHPHQKVSQLGFSFAGQYVPAADFDSLRRPYPYIAFVPQWDFLAVLVEEAERYPGFTLRMEAEGYELVREGGQVRGLRYRDPDGECEVRAELTVAADGRRSALRDAAGLAPVEYASPMDAAWFRLPRRASDPEATGGELAPRRFAFAINRATYWQIAYLFPKGELDELRARGVDHFRRELAQLLPFLADRVGELAGWDDVSVLSVRVDRLRRWYLPGLLSIGDAAHAMSPIAGVGINLAVQDAVAAANLLAEPLRRGYVSERELAAVQRRRELPTVVTQGVQRLAQARFVDPLLRGEREAKPPLPVRLLGRLRPGRHLAAWLIGIGARPEHVRTRQEQEPTRWWAG